MYEFIPKRTNTTARHLILLFFVGAGVLMLLTMILSSVPFRWVFQLIALGLLTAAVFLVTRYVTKLFLYRIEEGDLTVTEASSNGKRQLIVCRVGLGNVTRLTHLTDRSAAEQALAELKKQRIKLFDYTVELHPVESILIVVAEGGEELAILLAYDRELLDVLEGASKKDVPPS